MQIVQSGQRDELFSSDWVNGHKIPASDEPCNAGVSAPQEACGLSHGDAIDAVDVDDGHALIIECILRKVKSLIS